MPEFETPRGFQDNWRPPAKVREVITPPALPSSGGGGGDLSGVKARMSRIANKAPEVMVKVTGRTYGAAHVKAHLEYISRNGKLELECDGGDRMIGRRDVHDLADSWGTEDAIGTGRKHGSTTISVIFSMPPGTDPDRMKDAVRSLARTLFEGKHDYAMALHAEGKHPHVHLTLRTTGQDGQRLNPRKADLAEWREMFAERLRSRGIVAEATPRRARGVVRKAERTPVRKARERHEQGRGDMPRVRAMAYRQQAREMAGFDKPASRAWEQKIAVRQRTIRSTYLEGAAALARSADMSDRQLAQDVRRFVASMPPLALQRHTVGKEIAQDYDTFKGEPDHSQARLLASREKEREKGRLEGDGVVDLSKPKRPDHGRSR